MKMKKMTGIVACLFVLVMAGQAVGVKSAKTKANSNKYKITGLYDNIKYLEGLISDIQLTPGPPGPPGDCVCDITRSEYEDLLARVVALEGGGCLSAEICGDQIDNNCDGQVDEGCEPQGGYGIPGQIGSLTQETLTSSSPYLVLTSVDYELGPFDVSLLGYSAQQIYYSENGGSGDLTQAMAYDYLSQAESAQLLKTETEILYLDDTGVKTDFIILIDGYKIGVLSTRAYQFPPDDIFTVDAASALLEDKLNDVMFSTSNVDPLDSWHKQILFIFAYSEQYAYALETALADINASLLSDTIVIICVTQGDDDFLY